MTLPEKFSRRSLGPCPGCGSHNYDFGRFFPLLGLCSWCVIDAETRRARSFELRVSREEEPKPDARGCPFLPGTVEKIDFLRWRLIRNRGLFGENDARIDDQEHRPSTASLPDEATPDVRPNLPPVDDPDDAAEPLITGVEQELDRNRQRHRYRARPAWRGCKVNLGCYLTKSEANAVVLEFRRQVNWEERPKAARESCAAVVRIPRRWLEIEYPENVSREIAIEAGRQLMMYKQARIDKARSQRGGRILRRQGWPSERAALLEFRRLCRRIGKAEEAKTALDG